MVTECMCFRWQMPSGTVAVATDLDASSELSVICIYLLQQNLGLLPIALALETVTRLSPSAGTP